MEKTGTTESTGEAEPASTAEESTHERFEFHSRWTGVSTLPDRLITIFQTKVGGFWVAGFVFLPTGLLIGAFATHPILGGYYFACCLLMILLLVELLRRNREMVGRIDTTARTMELQRRNVRKDAWNSMTTDIDLSTIESVRFFAIGDWLIGALDSSKPFVSHSFVLPEGRFEEAVDAFERCDIPVEPTIDSKPATLQLNRRLGKVQAVAALVSVFVVPVIIAVRFPDLIIPAGGFLFLAGYVAVVGISVSWTYLRKKFASGSDSESRLA